MLACYQKSRGSLGTTDYRRLIGYQPILLLGSFWYAYTSHFGHMGKGLPRVQIAVQEYPGGQQSGSTDSRVTMDQCINPTIDLS